MKGKIWFTSDIHFYHLSNMYFHPKRRKLAGISLEELQAVAAIEDKDKKREAKHKLLQRYDNWLINLWNSTVDKEDTIYILGDFCLGNRERAEYLLNRLHGKKFLIIGNHDQSCRGLEKYFEWCGSRKELKFHHDQYPFIREGETFCIELDHFPMEAWNRKMHGSCHVHGHVHGTYDTLNEDKLRVDVGLDSKLADYQFIPIEKIYEHFCEKLDKAGCKTFQEYAEMVAERQGYRD